MRTFVLREQQSQFLIVTISFSPGAGAPASDFGFPYSSPGDNSARAASAGIKPPFLTEGPVTASLTVFFLREISSYV
jgi:hypothetical protein